MCIRDREEGAGKGQDLQTDSFALIKRATTPLAILTPNEERASRDDDCLKRLKEHESRILQVHMRQASKLQNQCLVQSILSAEQRAKAQGMSKLGTRVDRSQESNMDMKLIVKESEIAAASQAIRSSPGLPQAPRTAERQ